MFLEQQAVLLLQFHVFQAIAAYLIFPYLLPAEEHISGRLEQIPMLTGGALLITPYVRLQTDRNSTHLLSSNAFRARTGFN